MDSKTITNKWILISGVLIRDSKTIKILIGGILIGGVLIRGIMEKC